jgi:hypothetical protein
MDIDLVAPDNYIVEPDDRFSGGYSSIPFSGSITPQMYLEFAVLDLKNNQGTRFYVNAFANAKRAIHLQVDIINKAFGIDLLPVKLRNSFPMKMDFCKKCGIVGSRILNKYNKIRNKLEHEYYSPQPDEVEDMIDVTQLFLAATARFITLFPIDVEFELEPKPGLDIPSLMGMELPINEGVIYLFPDIKRANRSKIDFANLLQWQKDNSVSFKANEGGLYYNWVSFLVAHSL